MLSVYKGNNCVCIIGVSVEILKLALAAYKIYLFVNIKLGRYVPC